MVMYKAQRLLLSYPIIPIFSHMCLDIVLPIPYPTILTFIQMCLDMVLPLPHPTIPTFIQMCLDMGPSQVPQKDMQDTEAGWPTTGKKILECCRLEHRVCSDSALCHFYSVNLGDLFNFSKPWFS